MSPPSHQSRYDLLCKLAAGGMGTVYVGRVRGPMGFSRLVAIKRAHPHLADDPQFSQMLMDEAKLASRITHPHVVAVLDVERVRDGVGVKERKELRLVMDYVEGATFAELTALAQARSGRIPPGVAVRVVLDAAAGLQAAHDLTDESGEPLGIVHRDVSPHNVLVGVDGMARVSDFGIAKATVRPGDTTSGALKGKLSYMAPEYVEKNALDARSDVFSLAVVAWEALANKRLFKGENELATLQMVATTDAPALSTVAPELSVLDDVLSIGLSRDPNRRFSSARAFANALESEARQHGLVASHAEVGELVRGLVKDTLDERRAMIRDRARELDETRPAVGTVSGGELRLAVDAAQAVTSSPEQSASVPDAPGMTPPTAGTLDGTNKTGRRSRPSKRTALWAAAFVVGAGLALGTVLWWQQRPQEGRSNPASPAAASVTDAPSVTSEQVQKAVTASEPVMVVPGPPPSIAPSAAVRASSSGSAAPLPKPPRIKPSAVPAPTNNNGIPPNPYGTGVNSRL